MQPAQGLMFRERLGPNEGMIFPFPSPRPASFWMKNTLIPLDMIFIRPDGTIGRIAVNTVRTRSSRSRSTNRRQRCWSWQAAAPCSSASSPATG
jgi:uncharacterized membrane protein (UPF0127 family)